ncbi:hypothetical protein LWI28_024003 [Acer negundo]|uniref:Uncharacterized protein n=1 Tax=Acer negundo TaxID=4023 RepID=A0AAD5NTZ7_ACENE|nr:hypothetical protein LWI28_024003 [Acer negundo]
MLKGPGFIEKLHLVPGTFTGLDGSVAAINFPRAISSIWTQQGIHSPDTKQREFGRHGFDDSGIDGERSGEPTVNDNDGDIGERRQRKAVTRSLLLLSLSAATVTKVRHDSER